MYDAGIVNDCDLVAQELAAHGEVELLGVGRNPIIVSTMPDGSGPLMAPAYKTESTSTSAEGAWSSLTVE
jgi:hypothetical protein